MSQEDRLPDLPGMPEAVRTRVVALAAEALPDVVRLPATLRRVAAFAPARRARLGATAIAEALQVDEEFRERVGTQVRARRLPSGGVLADVPPAEVAAVAWMTRPEGWEAVLAGALADLEDVPAAVARESAELARLRDKVRESEQAVRELRAGHRAQVEELKAENSSLRRKLGESRAAERAARSGLEDASRTADDAAARIEAERASLEKEVRRLRAQVTQLEAAASAEKRAGRAERDEATMRARLLLDTVVDAASGLRRELGLPAVEGSPADRVEAAVERSSGPAAGPSARPALGPAALEQLLAMPRARLIVDGYNVSKTVWPSSSLEAQRIRLVNALAPVVARTGVETTVVFDAAASSVRPVVSVPRGVKVLFSPEGVIADDVIRDLVEAEPTGRVVVVVSSDREVARHASGAGARTAPAGLLVEVLAGTKR